MRIASRDLVTLTHAAQCHGRSLPRANVPLPRLKVSRALFGAELAGEAANEGELAPAAPGLPPCCCKRFNHVPVDELVVRSLPLAEFDDVETKAKSLSNDCMLLRFAVRWACAKAFEWCCGREVDPPTWTC